MRSRSSARAPGFCDPLGDFARRSATAVVRFAINHLGQNSILPQNTTGSSQAGHKVQLQGANRLFKSSRDLIWRSARRKVDRRPDADCHFAEMRQAAPFALHLPHAVKPQGHYGEPQVFAEEADAVLECRHPPVSGIVDLAFGENEEAVAAVDGFPGKSE